MESSIAISVIVPVYNSGQYLVKCIESLIHQTLKNIELIFVDDGSTDNSLCILNEYKNRDNRISIIKQDHLFAGTARNTGLDHAKGKYIIFLDSDDFFKKNMLLDAYNKAEKEKAQIVVFDNYFYNTISKRIKKGNRLNLPRKTFTLAELDQKSILRCKIFPWNKLFLRDFIIDSKIRFQGTQRCNDKLFVVLALVLAPRITYLPKRYVFYRHNNMHSLQGTRDNGREDFIISLVAIKEELLNRHLYNQSIQKAYLELVKFEIQSGMRPPFSYESLKKYYYCVKENLVPHLFDSKEEYDSDNSISLFSETKDYSEYLFARMNMKNEQMVSKKAAEYRVGKVLLKIPRMIVSKSRIIR